MRSGVLAAAVLLAVLFPEIGNAQVFQFANTPPLVTAANAEWQLRGDPVFYAGSLYYPAGPTVFFDPYVMARTGTFQGIPLYSDTTLEPYSIVYVPIGGNVMRPYERRRAGELTGTVGSRTPSFPIDRDVDVSVTTATTGLQFPPRGTLEPIVLPEAATAGTGGTVTPVVRPSSGSAEPARARSMRIESIPRPQANAGIWLEYGGAKWHAGGAAVPYSADRFDKIGDYHGFAVFRDRTEKADSIYIPAIEGGPLTRYQRP